MFCPLLRTVFEIESTSNGGWTGYRDDICRNSCSGSIDADKYTILSPAGVDGLDGGAL